VKLWQVFADPVTYIDLDIHDKCPHANHSGQFLAKNILLEEEMETAAAN